jgi:hypothetical protein
MRGFYCCLLLSAGHAFATWSVVIVDPKGCTVTAVLPLRLAGLVQIFSLS